MSADAPAQDRHSAMLAELAAMSLTLARDLQNRALEAESADEAAKLAAAFHRVARGLRQTLALELKVIRYKDEAAREAGAVPPQSPAVEAAAASAPDPAVARRLAAVRRRIRDAWSEHEAADWLPDGEDAPQRPPRPPPSDPLWAKLDAFLDQAEDRPDLLEADFDILVIEACDAIGLDARLLYDIRAPAEPAPADSS